MLTPAFVDAEFETPRVLMINRVGDPAENFNPRTDFQPITLDRPYRPKGLEGRLFLKYKPGESYMAETKIPPLERGKRRLFVGITQVLHKAVATICDEQSFETNKAITEGSCRGQLSISNRQATLTLVLNAIANAVVVSKIFIDYSDIVSILICVPGDFDDWTKQEFDRELISMDNRLKNAQIFVVSDLEVDIYRISRYGPGFVIKSGPYDRGYGRNATGNNYRLTGPGLGLKLTQDAIDRIINGRKVDGLISLEGCFLQHLHIGSRDDLEDILDFFDPIVGAKLNDEMVSLIAQKAFEGNKLARDLCSATVAEYVSFSKPIISKLSLQNETFPVRLQDGLWDLQWPFKERYITALNEFAQNAYLASERNDLVLTEAKMAFDRYTS